MEGERGEVEDGGGGGGRDGEGQGRNSMLLAALTTSFAK